MALEIIRGYKPHACRLTDENKGATDRTDHLPAWDSTVGHAQTIRESARTVRFAAVRGGRLHRRVAVPDERQVSEALSTLAS